MEFTTFYGFNSETGGETGQGVAANPLGQPVITGVSQFNELQPDETLLLLEKPHYPIVPTVSGSYGFVATLTADGTDVVASTYLPVLYNYGFTGWWTPLIVDGAGSIYVIGTIEDKEVLLRLDVNGTSQSLVLSVLRDSSLRTPSVG